MANEAGALVRVAGMFSQRGFNIETLNVAPTEDPAVSRLTLATEGTEDVVTQINRQLKKLVDVVEVRDMTSDTCVERELALLKAYADAEGQTDEVDAVERIAATHGAELVSLAEGMHTLQFVGPSQQLDQLIQALVDADRLAAEVRSGALAMARGAQRLHFTQTRIDTDTDSVSF